MRDTATSYLAKNTYTVSILVYLINNFRFFFGGMLFCCIISSFKENPNPDDKQRLDLAQKISLEIKQVKFWFQNRQTQMKVIWYMGFLC